MVTIIGRASSRVHAKHARGAPLTTVSVWQDIPEVEKQAAWTGQQPAKFDWDAEIAEVLERGKDVPEVTWCEPGEDAGWEVRTLYFQGHDGWLH